MSFVVTFLVTFLNLVLGFIVYRKNPKSATHRLLSLITIIVASWTISNYFSLNSSTPFQSLFWVQMVMFLTSPLGPAIYLFSEAYPYSELKISEFKTILIFSVTAILAVLAVSPLMFSQVILTKGVHPVPGPGVALYGIVSLIFLILSFRTIILKYKRSKGLVKVQLQYLVFGIIITFTLQFITNFLFAVVLGFSNLVIFGPVLSLILIGLISYSIVKHRFLDIHLLVARTIAYSLLISFISVFYTLGFFIIGSLFTTAISKQGLWISTILALIVAFSFQSLRHQLEKFTDNIFYKNRYDPQLLLENIGRVMASNISLNELTGGILDKLSSEMKISMGTIILLKENRISWIKTTDHQTPPEYDEKEINQLVGFFGEENKIDHGRIILLEDLNEGDIKDIYRKYNFNLVLRLATKQQKLGFLVLGDKSSGDIYSNEDLMVLDILGPQIAVAIQNSLSYEEIRQFSNTLQEKVKAATSELQKANRKLKELDELKDEFVSVASHELRTPMTAIKSYLWMALYKSPKPFDPKTSEYLDIAIKSTDRLIKLVQDLLTVSRIEGKRLIFNLETVDICQLAVQIYKELKIKADENRIKLTFTKPKKPLMVSIDKTRIMEVMENLLGNALKFTPKGGQVNLSLVENENTVEIHIKDTGPGIAKEEQELLFQKFSRLENRPTSNTPGTGLGLYIAKQIIALHHGKIWVESKVGEGSTFVFSLPLVKK